MSSYTTTDNTMIHSAVRPAASRETSSSSVESSSSSRSCSHPCQTCQALAIAQNQPTSTQASTALADGACVRCAIKAHKTEPKSAAKSSKSSRTSSMFSSGGSKGSAFGEMSFKKRMALVLDLSTRTVL